MQYTFCPSDCWIGLARRLDQTGLGHDWAIMHDRVYYQACVIGETGLKRVARTCKIVPAAS